MCHIDILISFLRYSFVVVNGMNKYSMNIERTTIFVLH